MAPETLGRHDSWVGVRAVVLGFGPAGFAAADNLNHLGADVIALDEVDETGERAERAELLRVLGADVRLGSGATAALPDGVDLVVTTIGRRQLLAEARERCVPVWGEVELAWRLRDPAHTTPWLCVTGAHDAAQTVHLLDSILRAAGRRSLAVGDHGLPIVEAVMDPEPYDVLAVELTASQLRHTDSMSAESAAVLNAGPDLGEDAADLGRVYERVERACVYNLADPETERLVREADVQDGARAIGFTLGMPGVGTVGVVEELLADRAFIEERASSAAELGTLEDLASTEPQFVANALAAAALARAHGVDQAAVRDGLRAYRPE